VATPTICLNMIVRNEAPVIDRCLASVLPFIDCWIVVDTGSSDGTQDHVRRRLRSTPGVLHERPWRNFAANRNEALELARGAADYLFFIDADETLHLPEPDSRPTLDADGYYLGCEYAGTTYGRCALVASRLPWRWHGVVHEFLTCEAAFRLSMLRGPRIVVSHDGARSRDPDTYANDAALLEEALRSKPNDARGVFYLAQSYRDAGQLAKSLEAYQRRALMAGWDEELWFSLYQAAVLIERLGGSPGDVSFAYLAAYQQRPTRSEPLLQLARYHRERGEFALALAYARRAASIPRPADLLFVDDAAYGWRALDELAITAYYAGARDEGRAALLRLLSESFAPAHERPRLRRNLLCYESANIAEPSAGASQGR
jgi:tetratricopeptide (TPR) repeat protein